MIYDCFFKIYDVWLNLVIAHKQKTSIVMLVVAQSENNEILCAFGSTAAFILKKRIERRHKQKVKQTA